MATSGIVYSTYARSSRIYVSWSQARQDTAGNYTDINWTAGIDVAGDNNWYSNAIKIYSIYINGAKVSGGGTYSNITTDGKHAKLSGTHRIYHNDNGKKTFSISFTGWFYSSYNVSSTSNSFALPDIPRATTPALSASSIALGGVVSISLPRAASAFKHRIRYSIGELKNQTSGINGYEAAETSATFTVPKSLANEITTSTSGTVSITCETYNGSTTIGTKTVSLTVTVPNTDEFKPTISSVTLAEAVSNVTSKFGNRYVKGQSRLNATISAAGAYGSTITAYETTIDGIPYSGSTFTSNTLTKSGTVTANVTVTDSRGRTASTSRSVTVVDYEYPSITIDHDFCNANGTINSAGTNSKLTMHGVVYPVGNVNTKSLSIKYKSTESSSYTNLTVDIASLGYTFDKSIIIANTDPTITWEFIATLTDKLKSTPATIKTGIVTMSRHAGGDGVTFGGEAEESGLVLKGWNLKMIGGDILINDPELEALADSLFG